MAKNKGKLDTSEAKDPEQAVALMMQAIEKQFGKGTVITKDTAFPEIERISSGSIGLDCALGGGYAKGRIIEVLGPESSGKTTMALHAIAEEQKLGGLCAFIDAEHALDMKYARNLGVNTERLLISQPDCGEQALELLDMMVRSGTLGLIVVDSVAALVPRAELEGEMGDSHMGLQARLMSQAMRKLVGITYTTNTTVIFINQIRMKIGVMFGSPETSTGGNALKFYASQRLDVRRIKTLAEGDDKTANRTRAKVIKNKTAPPYKIAEFNIKFGKGIDRPIEILDAAVEHGLIDKKGAWFAYEGVNIGQGTVNAAKAIEEDQELQEKLLKEIKEIQ